MTKKFRMDELLPWKLMLQSLTSHPASMGFPIKTFCIIFKYFVNVLPWLPYLSHNGCGQTIIETHDSIRAEDSNSKFRYTNLSGMLRLKVHLQRATTTYISFVYLFIYSLSFSFHNQYRMWIFYSKSQIWNQNNDRWNENRFTEWVPMLDPHFKTCHD